MFWKKYRYSLFTCLAGGLFAYAIRDQLGFFFSWCSIFIAIWLSVHDILSDSKTQSISDEAQLLAILNVSKYPFFQNILVKRRIKDIESMKRQLQERVFALNSFEMEDYTTVCVKDLCNTGKADRWYWATHMVDSSKSLDAWMSDSLEQNLGDEFVQAQVELINKGGNVVRVFIFDRNFFESNKETCKDLLLKHRDYYSRASKQVTTKACISAFSYYDFKSNDLTVVSNQFVFEWRRNSGTGNYDVGRCYFSKAQFEENFLNIKRLLDFRGTMNMDDFIQEYYH